MDDKLASEKKNHFFPICLKEPLLRWQFLKETIFIVIYQLDIDFVPLFSSLTVDHRRHYTHFTV